MSTLEGPERLKALEYIEQATKKADDLLKSITADNMEVNMRERSLLLHKIQNQKRWVYGKSRDEQKYEKMHYGVSLIKPVIFN